MNKILLILLYINVIAISDSFAQYQDNIKKYRSRNNVSLNILGDATLISANYERLIPIFPNLILAGNIGMGFNGDVGSWVGVYREANNYFTLSGHLSLNLGRDRLFFEIGLGNSLLGGIEKEAYSVHPIIGFRMLPTEKYRSSFRMFFYYPVNLFSYDRYFFMPLDFNFGYAF